MEEVLKQLALTAGTALISFGIAWLKKKADIKAIKSGKKHIEDF